MFLPRLDRAFKKKTTDPSADSIINSNEDQGQTTDAKLYMAGTDKSISLQWTLQTNKLTSLLIT